MWHTHQWNKLGGRELNSLFRIAYSHKIATNTVRLALLFDFRILVKWAFHDNFLKNLENSLDIRCKNVFSETQSEIILAKFGEPGGQLQCINDKYQRYLFPFLDVIWNWPLSVHVTTWLHINWLQMWWPNDPSWLYMNKHSEAKLTTYKEYQEE